MTVETLPELAGALPEFVSIDALWQGYAHDLLTTPIDTDLWPRVKRAYVVSTLAKMESELPASTMHVPDAVMAQRLNELLVEGIQLASNTGEPIEILHATPARWRQYILHEIYGKLDYSGEPPDNFRHVVHRLTDKTVWFTDV